MTEDQLEKAIRETDLCDRAAGSCDGSLTPSQFERDAELARENGFKVAQADPYTLLLDLDTDEAGRAFERFRHRIRGLFGFEEVDAWKSKSGNEHVVLRSPEPLDVPARVALQAILGSDPVRELLTLARLRNGVEEPSLLFRPTRTEKE